MAHYALYRAAFKMLHTLKAHRWLGPYARGAGIIFTLHHVRPWRERKFAPNRLLEVTPEWLDHTILTTRKAGFEFISLPEALDRLSQGNVSHRKPFAVLTFDDGYRNNREYAGPVLRSHNVPWTLFVTPGFADATSSLWWEDLEQAIRHLDSIECVLNGIPAVFSARTDAEKANTFSKIYSSLRAGPEDVLRRVIANLAEQAGVDTLAHVKNECLTWNELREMAKDPLLTIGAHTLTHPMLAKHPIGVARHEMLASRERIEHELNISAGLLAYPVGDPSSAGLREIKLAREMGFQAAVTTRPGHIMARHRHELHALPRVSLNGLFQTQEALDALLSGVPFRLMGQRG